MSYRPKHKMYCTREKTFFQC